MIHIPPGYAGRLEPSKVDALYTDQFTTSIIIVFTNEKNKKFILDSFGCKN